ncbi:MAG: UDP-N-acetylglucosamine-peptide N-acetylglucosaminyltransferase [Mesorhizobium sp.]
MTPALEKHAAFLHASYSVRTLKHPPMCEYRLVPSAGQPIRIGYLSSDFHNHATLFLLYGVLEQHDPRNVEIFIFSYGVPKNDEYSKRLLTLGVSVIDISGETDEQAARKIFERRIDILVELKGYTDGSRLGISGWRPAPIIVSWLGYPGTLGHPRLADYVISDSVITPPDHASYFSERLALMPHCYQPNDRRAALLPPPTRSEAGLPDEGLVFCSFNQVFKFNPQTFDIWARLIGSIQRSVLWLLAPRIDQIRANIVKEFNNRGVNGDRIIFAQAAPHSRHLARMRLVDLALDTFPYTSHTTGSDALWAGVPLVTGKGDTFASRVAASLLTTHGFPELITDNDEDYFRLALELATNTERRSNLKARLEQARATSPLFNTVQFTSDLERLYRSIADNHNLPEQLRARAVGLPK